MRRDILEKVAMDLFSLPPLIHRSTLRKLMRSTLANMDTDITPHHFEILHLLEEEGTLCIGAIGDRLQISKAQMTQLIDKLVELGLVERQADTTDRRAVNVARTPRAIALKDEQNSRLLKATRETVSVLTDEELESLSASLRKVRDILSKLQ